MSSLMNVNNHRHHHDVQSQFVGLETMFNLYCELSSCRSDLIVIFIHWYMVNNGMKVLISTDGEEEGGGGGTFLTEILPSRDQLTKDNPRKYTVEYSRDGHGFILKIYQVNRSTLPRRELRLSEIGGGNNDEERLIINLTRLSDGRCAQFIVGVNRFVSLTDGFDGAYKNLRDLLHLTDKHMNKLINVNPPIDNQQPNASPHQPTANQSQAHTGTQNYMGVHHANSHHTAAAAQPYHHTGNYYNQLLNPQRALPFQTLSTHPFGYLQGALDEVDPITGGGGGGGGMYRIQQAQPPLHQQLHANNNHFGTAGMFPGHVPINGEMRSRQSRHIGTVPQTAIRRVDPTTAPTTHSIPYTSANRLNGTTVTLEAINQIPIPAAAYLRRTLYERQGDGGGEQPQNLYDNRSN